jgi:hypothetical protein
MNAQLTNGNVFPPPRPSNVSECQNGARRLGFASPRQKQARPCQLRAVLAWRVSRRAAPTGTLHVYLAQIILQNLTHTTRIAVTGGFLSLSATGTEPRLDCGSSLLLRAGGPQLMITCTVSAETMNRNRVIYGRSRRPLK